MKRPARHTNDDGSRTTSRALVGSETPRRRKKKKKTVAEGDSKLANDCGRGGLDLANGGQKDPYRRRVPELRIRAREDLSSPV